MIDLDQVCGGAAAALTLGQIQQRCTNWSELWAPTPGNITAAIVSGGLVAVFVLIRRLKQKEDAKWVVLSVLEGLLYGALAGWFGALAGHVLALLLGPTFFGAMFLVFALLALLIMIGALTTGSAGGLKAVGVLCHLALAGALVVPAVAGLQVPTRGRAGAAFELYLVLSGLVFALTAFSGALIVSLFRGYHWAAGWLLVPINASWGALGNLLGLMNHIACLFYFNDWGKPAERRRWYVRYDGGFHLKPGYDFTEGDAMSGHSYESHEAAHVLQHFIAGPIYPLSHAAWMAVMVVPGIIAGAIARTVGKGITDFAYFNNPWEVIAYAFAGTRNDGDLKQPLIFNDVAAWIVGLIWILGATAGLVSFLAVRL